MHYVLDTNVFLRYLLQDDPIQSKIASHYIDNKNDTFILPLQMICEVIWVLTRLKATKTELIDMLDNIITRENFIYDNNAMLSGLSFIKNGGDFADGVIANEAVVHENAILLTFDKKAQAIANSLDIPFEVPE